MIKIKKDRNAPKTIRITIAIIVSLPLLWWCFFGGGAVAYQMVLYKYFGIEPPGDNSHHLRMTDEENVDLMKKALPPEEFAVWKAHWDLKHKNEIWKTSNPEQVKQIESDFLAWKKMHEQMRKDDYKFYRKKYPPLFEDQSPL